MHQYRIEGGYPLKGTIKASGNKNAALPCITAAILSEEEVVLKNIPLIEDVYVLFDILRELGGSVQETGNRGEFKITMGSINTHDVPPELAKKIRASILLAGPMLARSGKVVLSPPGGDVIGRRRLDTHMLVLKGLGAQIDIDGQISFSANKLKGDDIFLDEASVTATENAIMAAALAEGTTILRNVASEPHVQDLCNMINSMGGKISGIGSNILTIQGVKKLHGTEFSIGADFMEVGSYIGLAAVTGGDLTITKADPHHLRMVKMGFAKLGIHWETQGDSIHISPVQPMKVVSDLGGMIPKIDDAPWPGFPPDLLSIILTVATQVEGTILIHEKMFESRMFFVDKLIGMGAKIVLCDPHRAVISGPSRLSGSQLVSPDVRAGMAMVIAALAAEGSSTIQNIYQIERGYEGLADKLSSLGAVISREEA
ncbi:UDP-N-acetylglucosamine 1-carboxyvinyltransferase [Salinispira pacifica]|uniref:UDP-N-acetylglucosamine 1-carboxyvinyltransferase n=1 Tax=Salinispira pacifica TaxID=1307761 RepID=V5WCM3_9SPIO|nr:UDP-N-acetylglucosamine 1-carboxyvinyltransferase [Salinispira pacifica]AHC13517.1 UDP-N-acetylglucosamine 1-carboxyvinyltransferase [Salinispira pacifica]